MRHRVHTVLGQLMFDIMVHGMTLHKAETLLREFVFTAGRRQNVYRAELCTVLFWGQQTLHVHRR